MFLTSRNINLVCHNSSFPFSRNVGGHAETDLERDCTQVAQHPLCQWLVDEGYSELRDSLK